MKKAVAYVKLLRIPDINALCILPVIAALTIGVYDVHSLPIVFIIGAFSIVFGFFIKDYIDIRLDG